MMFKNSPIFSLALLILLLSPLLRIGTPTPAAQTTDEVFQVGVCAKLPPLRFHPDGQALGGLHLDLLQLLLPEQPYKLQEFTTEAAAEDALRQGQIDLILGYENHDKTTRGLLLTQAISSSELCLIVPQSAPQPQAKAQSAPAQQAAVFVSGSLSHRVLSDLGYRYYYSTADPSQLLDLQQAHPEAAIIGVKDSLLYQLRERQMAGLYRIQTNYLSRVDYCLAVRSQDLELWRELDQKITRLKADPLYDQQRLRWLPQDSREIRLLARVRFLMLILALGSLASLAILLISRRFQQVLKRQVAAQTGELNRANLELARQLRQLSDENDLRNRIIKYSPNGMLLVDLQKRVRLMNKSACAMAGLSAAPLDSPARDLAVFGEILQSDALQHHAFDQVLENAQIVLGESPASSRTYQYHLYPVQRYGQVHAHLLSVQDITHTERQHQAHLEEEKSRALTRLTAGIAHEIRNPLMSIRTFASLLRTQPDDKVVQRSFSEIVPQEVDRIDRLIESLIHYARPSGGHKEAVPLDQLIHEALTLISPLLKRPGFQVIQDVEADCKVWGNRDQFKQILINLLMNAIEAMEQRLRIEAERCLKLSISLHRQDDKLELCLRDEGIGMDRETLLHCRDPFYTAKEHGNGLGLALSEQFVAENQGQMSIDSLPMQFTEIHLTFERKPSCVNES